MYNIVVIGVGALGKRHLQSIPAVRGGLDAYLQMERELPSYAIVASSVERSVENVTALLKAGVKIFWLRNQRLLTFKR